MDCGRWLGMWLVFGRPTDVVVAASEVTRLLASAGRAS